jgi:hypothetical protein
MAFVTVPRSTLAVLRGGVAPLAALLLGTTLLLTPQSAAAQGDIRDFNLQNVSTLAIVDVRVTPRQAFSWGPNLLNGGTAIQPGQSLAIRFGHAPGSMVTCDYDVGVIASDGRAGEISADLCSTITLTFPSASGWRQSATLGRVVPTLPTGVVVQAIAQLVPVLSGQPVLFVDPLPMWVVDTAPAVVNPAIIVVETPVQPVFIQQSAPQPAAIQQPIPQQPAAIQQAPQQQFQQPAAIQQAPQQQFQQPAAIQQLPQQPGMMQQFPQQQQMFDPSQFQQPGMMQQFPQQQFPQQQQPMFDPSQFQQFPQQPMVDPSQFCC